MIASELYIMSRGDVGEPKDNVPELALMLQGQYKEVFQGSASRSIFGHLGETAELAFEEVIRTNVADFTNCDVGNSEHEKRLLQVLCIGISCLEVFIQNNWTGPKLDIEPSDVFHSDWHNKQEELEEFVSESLNQDDASIYPLCNQPIFLLLAEHVLVDSKDSLRGLQTLCWWSVRCLWYHQMILDNRDPEIHQKIITRLEEFLKNEELMSPERSGFLPMMFHIECIHVYQYYYQYSEAQQHLQTAKKISGLEVDLTGALGKRTKFQEEDKAQLLLKVEKPDSDMNRGITVQQEIVPGLPKDLMLDDDTVLNDIKFRNPSVDDVPRLLGEEQVLIIALCLDHKRKSPKDELLNEELLPFVVSVLRQPQYWSIQTSALSLRCKLERSRRRKMERAMMQLQAIVDNFDDGSCPINERFKYFYAANLSPKWSLERDLASLFMDLGSTSAALEVFHRLHLWKDVVNCYKRLGKPEKAIKVIRDQLAIKETVVMRCLLGEVTGKKEHFEQAWEFSNHKSSRAQKSLGLHYLREENYEKCIECLEKSLEKNYLQYDSWFTLGFAALEAKQYDTAARAYRSCVSIETDNFEAWNNLANAYTRLKQKQKAFLAFREAIKCNYENWKVWENYLVVSVDIGHFSEGIKAYHRLLELKKKFIDEEILGVLAKVVTENIHDYDGKPGVEFKDDIAKLFGHVTSQVTNNHVVWDLYAQVYGNCESGDAETQSKALHFLQKSHRILSQDKECFNTEENIKAIISMTVRLVEGYTRYSAMVSTNTEAIQTLSSAKLMLKGVIAKAKKSSEDLPEIWQGYQSDVVDLEQRLTDIQTMITEKK